MIHADSENIKVLMANNSFHHLPEMTQNHFISDNLFPNIVSVKNHSVAAKIEINSIKTNGWIQTLFLWILKSLNFGISTITSFAMFKNKV